MAEPINVVITGAAGQIGYSLVYMVASGSVFGEEQPLILSLLDIEPAMGVLGGLGRHPGLDVLAAAPGRAGAAGHAVARGRAREGAPCARRFPAEEARGRSARREEVESERERWASDEWGCRAVATNRQNQG